MLAHVYLLTFCLWSYGIFILKLEKACHTCIVWNHEKKDSRFVLFYYFKMLRFSCFILFWIPSKVIVRKYDLFKHVKLNTIIIICHYSVCIIYDLSKASRHKVFTISFERPVNYLCDALHVFPPKYEAWTHFDRPWTEYQCQGVVWTLLIIFTESVNWSTCLSVYLIITRSRNVNLLCFSDSIEGIDFLNCTLKCPVTLKLANQNRYFY